MNVGSALLIALLTIVFFKPVFYISYFVMYGLYGKHPTREIWKIGMLEAISAIVFAICLCLALILHSEIAAYVGGISCFVYVFTLWKRFVDNVG